MEFRTLKASEIDCRIGQKKNGKVSLLLYKDARVDMALLDETVGEANWQREHYECKGNLYCKVGIKIDGEWVWKSDCGTESNTEAEKGEASDSFKRACVNWGIGRELYTAPRIWISESDFGWGVKVAQIGYNDRREITSLVLVNTDGVKVFSYGFARQTPAPQPAPAPQAQPVSVPAFEYSTVVSAYAQGKAPKDPKYRTLRDAWIAITHATAAQVQQFDADVKAYAEKNNLPVPGQDPFQAGLQMMR